MNAKFSAKRTVHIYVHSFFSLKKLVGKKEKQKKIKKEHKNFYHYDKLALTKMKLLKLDKNNLYKIKNI